MNDERQVLGMKTAIIAGAGHGGLVAGRRLAQLGWRVILAEKGERETLGYDWEDTIPKFTLAEAGLQPRLVERGDDAARRTQAVSRLNVEGLLDPEQTIACPALLGTALMDTVASPAAQFALVPQFSSLTHKRYPKYAHERINAFENEFLSFLEA